MKKQLILLFIFSFSSINANLLKEYSIGFAPSFGFISGNAFSNPPVGSTFFIKTPFGLNFGSSNLSLSLGAGSYTGDYEGYINNPLFFGLGLNLTLAELLFAESHFGNLGHGQGFRTSAGITLSRLMKNLPVTASIGSEFFLTNDLDGRENQTLWAGLAVKIEYLIGGKANQSSGGSGPSAPNQRPTESTGNAKIDDFITKTYDLNDKIIDLKEKVTSISYGLSESNEVLSDIGTHPKGPLGWSFFQIKKGFSKSQNSIKAASKQLTSDVKDLPVIYAELFGETISDTTDSSFRENLLLGIVEGKIKTEIDIQKVFVEAFNKKAEIRGVPLTTTEWIDSLNLELDPTKTLKNKLGKINDGIFGGKDKLVSIPNDLKDIGTQAQTLLSSASELPAEAKSLGMKAPKALKAIKNTTGVLKNIPNEIISIGDEAKKVVDEIDQVLKNIQNILSSN